MMLLHHDANCRLSLLHTKRFPICAAAGVEFSKLQVAELLDGTQKVKMARLGGEIAEGKIICRWSTFQKLQVVSLGGETAGGGVFRWLTEPAGGWPWWKKF